MKTTSQGLIGSNVTPGDRSTARTTHPDRFSKKPPVPVICLLLLACCLTCPRTAAAQSPTITAGPTNRVLAAGGVLMLGVTASGPAPAYQWFKDSRRILGATNNTLTVTNAGVNNSGTYYVLVTNENGMVISQPASVAVGNPALLAWGRNLDGQLGNSTTNNANLPIPVASNVVAGAAGAYHSLFVGADGILWAMGYNFFGQLGNGTWENDNPNPTPISVASNVVAVAAGLYHSLFVKTDGTLWAMGYNDYGELGNGAEIATNRPISVASNVVAVVAGSEHSLFLTSDGTLWVMGWNYYGQLGNGKTSYFANPTPISVASNVVAMAAGYAHSLFVKTDGTLWAMGYNAFYQLGNGRAVSTNRPISVASNVVAVAAGYVHSLFMKTDGTLWAMGYNSYGQLGNGTTSIATVPISVASNVVAVAAGVYHSLFVTTDGSLRAMGWNGYGQLGNGTMNNTNLPVIVPHLSAANIIAADQAYHSMAIGINNIAADICLTGGIPTLSFPGIPGNSYSVARSTNLSSWTVIWTTNEPAYGVFQFTDPGAPQPNAFYRLQPNF
jgi:alpha-tubulin suppressor-like RCC1 family protein